MSTIAEKLNYLNDTKGLFKNRINSLGGEITEQTTFRNYITWLDKFYNEVSDETDMAKNGIVGDTEQDSTTGKNLFDYYNYPVTRTKNGVTCINNGDGTITLNGTATGDITFELGDFENIKNYVSSQSVTHSAYYISGSVQKVSTSTVRTVIRLNYNISSSMIQLDLLNSTNTKEYKTQPQNTASTAWAWQISIGEGDIFNNFTIKYQLEKGDESTDYEPYTGGQPSPNPDFPQEIKNRSGDLSYKVTGKNLLDLTFYSLSTTYYSVTDNNIIVLQQDNRANSGINESICLKLLAGVYTFITPSNFERALVQSKLTGTTILDARNVNYATFTLENDDTIYIKLLSTSSTYPFTINKPMLLKGTYTTYPNNYEPYISRTFPINLKSKNLFDKDNANILDAYIGASSILSNQAAKTLYIPIKPNTTYTVSKISSARFIIGTTKELPKNDVNVSDRISDYHATEITTTSNANAKYLVVFYYASSYDTLTEQEIRDSIQIEENDHATPYMPYTTPYDIQLCKQDTYQDFIKRSTGKNLFDEENKLAGYYFESGEVKAGGGTRNCLFYTKCQPNTAYSMSFTNYQNVSFIQIATTQELPQVGSSISNSALITLSNLKIENYITSNNAQYIIMRVQSASGTDIANNELSNFITNLQLEENDHATPYMPYTTPYDIQLCKQDTYQDFIKRSTGKNIANVTLTHNYVSGSGLIQEGSEKYLGVSDKIQVEPNTQYTISFTDYDIGNFYYGTYDENGTFISRVQIGTELRTFTTDSNVYFIRPYFYNSNEIYDDLSGHVQLEQNDHVTEYEPYGHQFYLHKNIGDVVLDGTEDWEDRPNYNNADRFVLTGEIKTFERSLLGYSNYFIIKEPSFTGYPYCFLNNTQIGINYSEKGTTTLAQWKSWLSTHNTKVQYVLQTPTTEVISEENYPVLYKQLSDIQDYLTSYKINKEFILGYDEPSVEY